MAKKTAKEAKIKYVSGNQTLLDQIQPLWENLNQHHCQHSADFKSHYLGMTFMKRKFDLLKKAAAGEMHVTLAVDEANGQSVGYLVSSLNAERTGELESLFVNAAYRERGIGDFLMLDALAWMDKNGAKEKIVEVAVGNEQAWGFYGRYGFLPRKTLLKQAKKA